MFHFIRFIRRGVLASSVALLVACSGTPGTGTTPSLSSAHADVASPGHMVFQKLSIVPDATAPAIIMNFVSNGPAQGGVPCISCVEGAQTNDNVGLTGPSSYVTKGSGWQYSLSFTDIKYKGKCKLAWTITSGAKTIDSFSATLNLTTAGGFVLYALNRNRPAYSGSATLTGKVTCGGNSRSTTAPLYFQ